MYKGLRPIIWMKHLQINQKKDGYPYRKMGKGYEQAICRSRIQKLTCI